MLKFDIFKSVQKMICYELLKIQAHFIIKFLLSELCNIKD